MKSIISILFVLLSLGILSAQQGSGDFENEVKIGPKTSADTTKAGMMQFSAGDFKGYDGSVWKSFTDQGVNYGHVVTVAVSGGDFTTIQAAINSCGATSPLNPCLVRVMPGTYTEPSIVTKQYLLLQGSGKYSTTINGPITATDNTIIEGFNIPDGISCFGVSPKISSNLISNSLGDGILVDGTITSARPWIENNDIRLSLGYGIRCTGGFTFNEAANPWIIHNKIDSNLNGGIICTDNAWPTISNNQLIENYWSAILLIGNAFPTEPTISDNVIAHTIDGAGIPGTGIVLQNLAEPRIIANDIYGNKIGIDANASSQPSILSNEINYNDSIGIRCASAGASKRVMIQGNHIHSNGNFGIMVLNPGDPVISHNEINYHNVGIDAMMVSPFIFQNTVVLNTIDIQYFAAGPFPVINLNVYDVIFPGGLAAGINNATSGGAAIGP